MLKSPSQTNQAYLISLRRCSLYQLNSALLSLLGADINSQTQYFHKAERQCFSGCCQHTLLHSVGMDSGEKPVTKQPIFHSSPLPTILRNFSAFYPAMPLLGDNKSPKNCMTLHRGPKILSQNKTRPLCFPLFDSSLFLKSTFGEVYLPFDIQFLFFA